tara:strand:- start:262 stop:714 length:453 start_codon:yes stop_codon:yes gene_type:complete
MLVENRTCKQCTLVLPISSFPKSGGGGNRKGLDINGNPYRRHQCRDCHWELKKNLPSGRIGKAKLLKEYKEKCACAECGYSKERNLARGEKFSTWALNFHHHNSDKLENVGSMIKRYGWNKILEEISKCIVICFNCHMALHDTRVHEFES